VRVVKVESAREMLSAVQAHWAGQDVFIATAAVADWRPAQEAQHKIKKDGSGDVPALQFVENPDILATMAARRDAVFCVGFAAESEQLVAHAQAKRVRKGVPLLVGNIGPATFGQDDNALLLVDAQGARELPHASKQVLATQLIEDIARRLGSLKV
jgi:phosphopantothenoylcysteine decarboxylase/phosphopantothenate--cysteine ligase